MATTAAGTERHLAAVFQLEQLLARRHEHGWRRRVDGALSGVRDWLESEDDHDGAIVADAPRLAFLMRRLQRQRRRMLQRLDKLPVGENAEIQLERPLRQLVREAHLYRRGMAELLYQAYEVDLGGEH